MYTDVLDLRDVYETSLGRVATPPNGSGGLSVRISGPQ
jgi:hypothetical protein